MQAEIARRILQLRYYKLDEGLDQLRVGNGRQWNRAYEERYHKMMEDAGFIGQKRSWEEYMDYIRTPVRRLALALFNRMADWKKEKSVP